jgi:hypothetical protein
MYNCPLTSAKHEQVVLFSDDSGKSALHNPLNGGESHHDASIRRSATHARISII